MSQLNDQQAAALEAITDWLAHGDESFFVLSGFAGTGKTYTVRALRKQVPRLVFTAPTNKAVRVLRETLTEDNYKPECRTTFSLLGLRMQANGEVKEIGKPEDGDETIDLSSYRLIVVDEGSMVSKILFDYIQKAAYAHKVKFLFMGDSAQLPPVNEVKSRIWDYEGACLTKVMRYDNQLLALATHIREQLQHPIPRLKLETNWDAENEEGVKKIGQVETIQRWRALVAAGHFQEPNRVKVIAWRNVTVDKYNKIIRDMIFPDAQELWATGDRIIMTAPAKNLDDEIVARTDDEGTVQRVSIDWHPVYGEFKCYTLSVEFDDGFTTAIRLLHPEFFKAFAAKSESLAQDARRDKRLWKSFWDLKDSFHSARYAYAITAHRSQGSTYESTFVDWRDILINPNGPESTRCLYVACTRAKKQLFLIQGA